MPKTKEYYNLFAWIGKNKKKTKIGYAFKTDRGTMHIKADDMLDATKLGRALLSGIEIEKRQPQKKAQQPPKKSAAVEYEKAANG